MYELISVWDCIVLKKWIWGLFIDLTVTFLSCRRRLHPDRSTIFFPQPFTHQRNRQTCQLAPKCLAAGGLILSALRLQSTNGCQGFKPTTVLLLPNNFTTVGGVGTDETLWSLVCPTPSVGHPLPWPERRCQTSDDH